MKKRLKLLSIAHSYVVALNRRLANEMAIAGGDRWEVVAAAPKFVHGDLRPISFESIPGEKCRVEKLNSYFSGRMHVMLYGLHLRALLNQSWDFIHAWEEPYIFPGGEIAWLAPAKIPLVFWTAQNLSKKYPPPFCWIERYCVNRCSGWLACGETTLQTQLARGYAEKPHRVMPLGVDLEVFQPRKSSALAKLGWAPDGPPVVGYLGRFVAEKGIRILIEALENVTVPWRALFVGGGTQEPEIQKLAVRFPERVKIAKGVSHDEVPDYINAMDCLCAPSQTIPQWREQFGRMIVEAFACGVPVIGSDSGEIPFVIADAGRIVGEKDVAGWTRAISELLDNPSLRRELSQRGLERVRANYAWPIIARRHLEFFEEILEKR